MAGQVAPNQPEVFGYIKTNENTYRTTPVPVVDGYEWNMYRHVKLTTLYLNSRYETGNQDDKPFKNIILDKVNLQHRAIDYDVKDIIPFVNSAKNYYKSFLVRKYHEQWAREVGLGSFFNEMGEQFTDYGGTLVKKMENARPTRIPFQQLAFCDQTNLLAAPICEKHQMTPAELYTAVAEQGWNKDAVDTAILKSSNNTKQTTQTGEGVQIKTPGKYIEVYELHGVLPKCYLHTKEEYATASSDEYMQQMHIVAFYQDDKGDYWGLVFYQGKEKDSPYEAEVRDEIYGRALGRGGVEELFEDQVWTNYSEIQQKEILDQAAKIFYQTADKKIASRNKTSEIGQGEILQHEPNMPLSRVDNSPQNMVAFENACKKWDDHAKTIASAFDSVSGDDPKSGMPFRLGMLLNQEAHSMHRYRKQKLGLMINRLYKNWILPEFRKALTNKQEFMSLLTLDEMHQISEAVIANAVNQKIAELVLGGNVVTTEDIENLKTAGREMFYKGGNNKFFGIYEQEMETLPIDVDVITDGEQKNLALISEKLSSVFAQVMQVLQQQPDFFVQHPEMAAIFNEILESSGLSPLSYGMSPVPVSKVAPDQSQANAAAAPVDKVAAAAPGQAPAAELPVA